LGKARHQHKLLEHCKTLLERCFENNKLKVCFVDLKNELTSNCQREYNNELHDVLTETDSDRIFERCFIFYRLGNFVQLRKTKIVLSAFHSESFIKARHLL